MKKLFVLLFILCSFCLFAGSFNVKDYGAKGDGKTDDTAAIRKAVDSAVKASRDAYAPKTVYFPSGRYVINGTIKLRAVSLQGNKALILQKDKNAIAFEWTDFWHVKVSGLTFNGGRGHITVTNDNLDKSLFAVEHCKFFHTSGTALQTLKGAQSTLFTVSNCEFIRCMCSIDSDCDWTTIRDTWIMNPVNMSNSAVIVNRHGYMSVDNLLGVPLCNGNNQRWIDNYAWLTVTNCRFGGEGGGFTAVYNYAKARVPGLPYSVVMKECEIDAHSSGLRNCAVYCFEIPNAIAIENCRSTMSAGVLLDKSINTQNYLFGTKNDFCYKANGNAGFKPGIIPPALANIVIKPVPLPPEHLKGKALADKISAYKVTPKKGTCEVNALTLPGAELVLDGYMDGSNILNSDLLAIVRKADPACIMRTLPGNKGIAPFAELRHVTVDLDKTPYLLIDMRSNTYGEFAIKYIDESDGRMYSHSARQQPVGKLEVYLPKVAKELTGKKTFTFRIYYIGRKYVPRRGKKLHGYLYADAGSVLEIHELGFNSKPVLNKGKNK